jgi:SAM-dependent methyltransferase
MSKTVFDPSRVTGYGTTGQNTARKMNDVATSHSLELNYNTGSKQFTLLGSSDISKEALEKIFAEKVYDRWKPQILYETDSLGNRLFRLVHVDDSLSASATHRAVTAPMGRSWTRDDYAADLVRNIERSLRVSLDGKNIIDVGCRSGENALAMQAAGATVIGIDPDDREFGTAKEKGIKDSQLVKATLQEFHEKNPETLFDVATVFLWNILFKERESFIMALKEIIQPDGYVIIGYNDEIYDKDPYINVPKLMKTAFHTVKRREFPESLNRYMLVCRKL